MTTCPALRRRKRQVILATHEHHCGARQPRRQPAKRSPAAMRMFARDSAAIAANAQGAYRASAASDAKFDKVTPTRRTPLGGGKTERIKSRLAW